ncbi:thiol-disulfide oxidoreductase ResA [bacterium BMS3Abin03]|nr:thiol-disulfide oxidoreductase ResA [bacterium BMS3Abin03]
MLKMPFILFVVFTISIYGCKQNSSNDENSKQNTLQEVTENSLDKAPDFSLYTLDGTKIKLSDYKGKTVILDFWATWCPPCRKGIPDLVSIQDKFKDDLVIIGISLDQPATQKDLPPFIENYGINYPVVLGTMEVVTAYGNIQAIPTSFIIDKDGYIVNKHVGLIPKSQLVDEVSSLISGP